MCGIVGYVGTERAVDVVLSGLQRLEYRGYDSAGLAAYDPDSGELSIVRTPGKIAALRQEVEAQLSASGTDRFTLGIGHTRWATHGAPTTANAHPHRSQNGKFAVVHNGIIENYVELRRQLVAKGYTFLSETDTEVIAHLIEECYEGDLRAAVAATLTHLEGAYGIAVISAHNPGLMVAARRGSPLVVGVSDSATIIASDVSALASYTQSVVYLDDGDILSASAGRFTITASGNVPVSRDVSHIDWDIESLEKGGHAHFMLKEIHEQPQALANALRGRLLADDGTGKLSGMQLSPQELARVNRVVIAGCGTSLYAGQVGKYLFEDIAGVPTDVQQAAEFRYRNPIIEANTLVIAISQSGETADTLAAVREAQRKGATVLSICNVVGSSIARETGRGVYLHAGPEIGVASTKAFTAQVAVLALMAIVLGRTRRLSLADGRAMVEALNRLPEIAAEVIARSAHIAEVAERHAAATSAFFIGRGYMHPAAMEGALKLKEISYIHAEGYHAAELKHGPIALLEAGVPVIAAVPNTPDRFKTISNMQECRARKSPVIAIASDGDREVESHADDVIWIPECPEFLAVIPVVIAEQLFAYHTAHARGCAIDQPRNLAKAVTVE